MRSLKRNIGYLCCLLLIFVITSCKHEEGSHEIASETVEAILPSWNDGATRNAIIEYVTSVVDEKSPDFIPVSDRIATFDNDGNLLSEQPMYFQLFFTLDRIKELAPQHPEWKDNELIQAVMADDIEKVMSYGEHGLIELIMYSHAGTTTIEFEEIVKNWFASAIHPRFNKPFNELIYQPMLELLDYLRANGFSTFVVSGGGIEFMRPWVEKAYGIPPHQVVGSSIKAEFDYNDGNPIIRRLPELNFIDDKAGKPIGIHQYIGKKPVFASGNSDGDLQMLQWTDSSP